MANNRYYNAMSLAKQIGLAVLATISLVVFGFGSYYASQEIFPDPESETTTQNQSDLDTDAPKISDSKRLAPQNIQTYSEENEIVLSYETVDAVGTTVYVTTDENEKVDQVIKDYRNGVSIAGRWFVASTPEEPTTSHLVRIPKSMVSKDDKIYYYILLRFGDYWLPYGEGMDYESFPYQPYEIKL